MTKVLVNDLPPRPSGPPAAAADTSPLAGSPQRPPTLSRGLPAWLLSFLLHATLLIALGLMVRVAHRGANLESARGGGIVLSRNVDGAAEYYGEGEDPSSEPSESTNSASSTASALPSSEAVPIDLSGAFPKADVTPLGSEMGDSLPSADDFTKGGGQPSRGRVGGNQAKTSVFGAEGVGSKFVYVFDRSASMDGYQGRPIRAAKAELIASLTDLDKVHQFQILFYNDRPLVFNPDHPQAPRMLFGEAPIKRLAQNFVRGIVAAGGTQHLEALNTAIGMNPDVIFFLTDAAEPQLSSSQLEAIRQKNNRVGATIHAIEFGAGPQQGGGNFLMRLARQNGGTYIYVDVTQLPAN